MINADDFTYDETYHSIDPAECPPVTITGHAAAARYLGITRSQLTYLKKRVDVPRYWEADTPHIQHYFAHDLDCHRANLPALIKCPGKHTKAYKGD